MNKISHIHLKGPFIKAAKALLPEKPTSLGWYKNHWAFLFNGRPSERVIEVARKTGFIINENNSHTMIALPDIKEHEIKKATQKLNIFAEEYQSLSKKVISVINKSINKDARVIKSTIKSNTKSNLRNKGTAIEWDSYKNIIKTALA